MATAKHTAPRFDLSDKDAALATRALISLRNDRPDLCSAALARLSPEGVSALLRLLTARPARPTMGA